MNQLRLIKSFGYPNSITGHLIEAALAGVSIGEVCEVFESWHDSEPVARAQVVGFRGSYVLLNLIGSSIGLSSKAIIKPTGRLLTLKVKNSFLGAVLDASGQVIERLTSEPNNVSEQDRLVDTPPPSYLQRAVISEPLVTGIRVIDGMLTCGIGQRIGIFSSAGCGKTVLMHMLIEHTSADVFVIGLIGERGREVTECAESLRKSSKAGQCVLIYATSDFSAVDRCNAALLATTVAEFFRDQGKRVVLYIDSATRYARALRDMKLAAGEPPARRGYPASVFDSLPRLLERPGVTVNGSITAFYTVLLEGEDESDPLGDEIRSILDGHIYLSRKLAGQGHYPAIEVLKSVSRVFGQVTEKKHRNMATDIRKILTTLNELQLFIDLGEYKAGQNKENDRAMNVRSQLMKWLCQSVDSTSTFPDTLQGMMNIVN
ncbi:TPA: type III secretion system ATPase SctN [Yersinia enterocolitica]|nr:type III secretion system ATPase SctN [Yersinia enterocolitica]HDL6985275.1 type III secretion system ATPase SctN [Yersinia enterocolitica]HDL7067817.1 type III secretion system ATPase SctN [Yersinia enterocolitica]HDL7072206.1 type III secretion system ATPase SctN [Yersinia enterocolitica]